MNNKVFKIIVIILSFFISTYLLLLVLSKIGWFSLGMNTKEYPKTPDKLEKIQNYLYLKKGIGNIEIYNDDALWILNRGNCNDMKDKVSNFEMNLGEIKPSKYKDQIVLNKLLDSISKEVIKNIHPKECFDSLIIKYNYFDSTKINSYTNFRDAYIIK